MIRLAIAEDQQPLIDGIVLFLKEQSNIEIVGTTNDGETLLKLIELKQPKAIITDIRMPKIPYIWYFSSLKLFLHLPYVKRFKSTNEGFNKDH